MGPTDSAKARPPWKGLLRTAVGPESAERTVPTILSFVLKRVTPWMLPIVSATYKGEVGEPSRSRLTE